MVLGAIVLMSSFAYPYVKDPALVALIGLGLIAWGYYSRSKG